MNLMKQSRQLALLSVMATATMSGGALAQGVRDWGGVDQKSREIQATEDARERKLAAEDTFEGRLDTALQEIADLKEQIEGRAENSDTLEAAIANAEERREAAADALNDYKAADVAEWMVFQNRAEEAFREMNDALDRAHTEVIAH